MSEGPLACGSRLAGVRPRVAWLALGLLLAGWGWCLGVARTAPPPDPAEATPLDPAEEDRRNDLRLYRAIVDRVHHGEPYYDAAEAELRARGYPMRSVFNWRPPLYAWLLGHLPALAWGRALFIILALSTVWFTF